MRITPEIEVKAKGWGALAIVLMAITGTLRLLAEISVSIVHAIVTML
jgi:hypothetical protein